MHVVNQNYIHVVKKSSDWTNFSNNSKKEKMSETFADGTMKALLFVLLRFLMQTFQSAFQKKNKILKQKLKLKQKEEKFASKTSNSFKKKKNFCEQRLPPGLQKKKEP